jgi:glutathione synthase/RimK-type ligase-like ATP-grasp enzyme
MTNVLIISNKSDVTSDFIVKKLKERSINFYRLNTEDLTISSSVTIDYFPKSLTLFDLICNKKINLNKFSSVYFRRPEIPSFDSLNIDNAERQFLKNEFAYALEGIYKFLRKAYWVSPIYAIREAENKIYQLELAKSLGFKIPKSIITSSYSDFLKFYNKNGKTCIIKPIKSGLINDGNNSRVVFTSILNGNSISKKQFEISPNFFQEHIHKKGDIRVTIVGNKAFAALIHSQGNQHTQVDWRRGENVLKHTKVELPSSILNRCFKLMSKLNLRFGAIDLILDENDNYVFLEINPNGQWAWIEKQTGYEISNEIVNLLEYENN